MRMSDWSSDVCSSDLIGVNRVIHGRSCHDAAELQSTIFVVKCGGIELQRAVCEDVLGADLEGIDRFRAETLADGENRRKRRIDPARSEEHTSELQSLMRISYAVFCLKKKIHQHTTYNTQNLTHIKLS